MRKLFKALGYLFVILVIAAIGGVSWLAMRSPKMQPPSQETLARTPQRLARGGYLVLNVADCLNCHSDHLTTYDVPVKPGTEGQGGFVFDKSYGVPGIVCAQNITPDPEFGIGQWSDGEVMRAFREGVTPDGRALFPMMPYPYYRLMSDEDAKSVVVYLRSLAPVHHSVPQRKLDFPVNYLIKFTPQPVSAPVTAPEDAKDHLGYGRYLVTVAGCMECHTPHDAHGQLIPGREYSGGWEMLGPWGRVVTANITPDRANYMGQASRDEFIGRFKAFAHLNAANSPEAAKGRNTIMPWLAFSGMTEQDLGAIYDYLRTLRPISNKVNSFPDAVVPARREKARTSAGADH